MDERGRQRWRLGALALWLCSAATVAEHYTVPLFVSAFTSNAAQGSLRVVNPTGESGTVEITAIDDTGFRSSSATFSLNAWGVVEFDPSDLSEGNAAKGLSNDLGIGDGHFRLVLDADIPIEPSAYVRAPDGTLSAMHDTVRAEASESSGGYTYNVPVFNPSTEMTQLSRLRLINPGDAAAAVMIGGRDDSGAAASGGDVTLTLAAGGAKTLTAQQLEAGDTDLTGRLGAGTGKWRLTVSSDRPLEVVNIVASAAGYWNNLSTTAVAGTAPANLAAFNERFAGNNFGFATESDGSGFTFGLSETGHLSSTVSHEYESIGPDAGYLAVVYEDGDRCRFNMHFVTGTGGWFSVECADGPLVGGGNWWARGSEDMAPDRGTGEPGDGADTTYGVDDTLPGVPTSGFFIPAVTSGGSVSATASGTTVALNNGGYIELNDGTRYTCASVDGCSIVNGTVTAGAVTGRAADAGEVDRFPSFRTASNPGDQSYTVGTAIDTLTLPMATGGDGDLTYSLSPSVPGLTFNATTRQLSGTPSTAGTHVMTYTVTDEDGDTDTLGFTITVSAGTATGGSLGVCQVGMTLSSGQSCTYPGTTDQFSVSVRGRGQFLTFLAGIRIRINNSTINGRVYDFEASHQGDGVWRIDRIAGSTEAPMNGGTGTGGTGTGTSPSFAMDAGPGNQTYTVGTEIAALTLPDASGGDGPLTYSLTPTVPGLSFNATASVRHLTGTPTTAGTYDMIYRVRDTDGDTDSLTFAITVESAAGGGTDDTDVPASPTNVRYVRDVSTTVVSWDAVQGADYYKIYYDDFFGSGCRISFGRLISCEELADQVTGTSYAHRSPDDDRNYYWVVACNSGGCSEIDRANPADFVDTRPSSPTNVRYARDGTTIVVSWDAVQGADYYKIYYDDFFGSGCRISFGRLISCEELADQVTGTSYTHRSPDDDRNYYWVVACNSGGCSDIDRANPANEAGEESGGGTGAPDLTVESASVSNSSPSAGASFTLSATVRNRGDRESGSTTLRYYRSTNATISRSGTQVGTDSVTGLSASGTSAQSISLTAPSSAGTYYYGACVDSVTGESDTGNNCSTGVRVAVSSGETGGGGDGGTGEAVETTYGVNDALPGVPTSGNFFPAVTSGGSVSGSGAGTTITLRNGGYIELSDGTRYTCTSTGGCMIENGTVTQGTVIGGPEDDPESLAPADTQDFNNRVVGNRFHGTGYYIDFPSAGRFLESGSRAGSYSYSSTGSNTGTLTHTYDDSTQYGGSCTFLLSFDTETTGTLSYTCASEIQGRGSWTITASDVPPAPQVVRDSGTDTSMRFGFGESFDAGETKAFDFQVRRKTPQGAWDSGCDTFTNDSANSGRGVVSFAVTGLQPGTVYEARYRSRNSSSCDSGSPGPWSLIGEGGTTGAAQGLGFTESGPVRRSIPENVPGGINVGTPVLAAGGDALAYSIGGVDAGSFEIVPETGQIRTSEDVWYDFETKNRYEVEVTVADDGGSREFIDVTIDLLDLGPNCNAADNFGLRSNSADGRLTARWNALPDAAGRARVLGYQTEIRRGGTGPWTDRRTFLGQAITGATYASLDNGIAYQIRVRAVNSEGDCGWSVPVSGIPTGDLAPKDDIEHVERFGPHPIGTDDRNFRLVTPGRCRHTADGVKLDAGCNYERTSPNAGRITLEFDDQSRGSCDVTLAYSSLTAGSFIDECFDMGVNTNVPFDRSFRMPWSVPRTEDDFDPEIETEPQRAPRNQDEFDALVYGRDDFIPGLCFGNCNHGNPPEIGIARRFVIEPNGSTSERYGHYTYESTGPSQGVLSFAENTGSTWVFTLDFEPSGNVGATISDANGNATDWLGVSYADIIPTTPILLPIPPIWHGLEYAIHRLTPKTIGELASLLGEVNDSDDVGDTSVVNDYAVIRLLVSRYLRSFFGETLGDLLAGQIADVVDTEVTVGFRRLMDNRVIIDLKFNEGRQANSSEILRSVIREFHREQTTSALKQLLNGAISGGLSGIPLAGYLIGKLYDWLIEDEDNEPSGILLQTVWNFFLNQMSGLRITYECTSTGNITVYECGVTGDKEGEIPLVGYLPVDLAGDRVDFSEFPTESFLPDDPPQASGEDVSGVEVAAAISTPRIGPNDVQVMLVSGTGGDYQPGDWLEPKDGGNQRMMIVSAGQATSIAASAPAPRLEPSDGMTTKASVPLAMGLNDRAYKSLTPGLLAHSVHVVGDNASRPLASDAGVATGFKTQADISPYMISGFDAAGTVRPSTVVSTAADGEFVQLNVVCMQVEQDIPTRGARYFSASKTAEGPVQTCQKQCVLNESTNIQRCVWACEH